ncbi:TPA: type I methionyl aminopeptidase [Patescibacteria group bacterium]|nr:MAG: Methionine aminopeptidase [Parcubacteria group bacterium GW2011_GWD2_42_14]HCC05133.1 type I methionyl aminopeptidase [Patescibacteria group bacterium]
MSKIKSPEDIAGLIELGKRHAQVLEALSQAVKPGVSTAELEERTLALIHEVPGDEPAFKNYKPYGASRPYPCALCTAPNNVVVHGIPTEDIYILKEGDIIGLDIGIKRNGLITDAGITVPVGNIDKDAVKLLRVTKEALFRGIAMARAGNHVGDIGNAIESYVRKEGYGLVRELCGHGVGHSLHEEPQIPNYGKPGTGAKLEAGMVLAIEPMLNEGRGAVVFHRNGYSVSTADGSRSAHFEHDVIVTKSEPIILTLGNTR